MGLPLARLFATKNPVVGFDINATRIQELCAGIDSTLEVNNEELKEVLKDSNSEEMGLYCTNELDELKNCNFYIVTVPTPVDQHNRPVLGPLQSASRMVAELLKKGDYVIYESTVYPGATEEVCVPILETISGLTFNEDFYVGYSPERINPGDKEHTVEKILKVTSGSTENAAKEIDALYRSVIKAGTFCASSLKVAEAAKVIENAQRDINIAFVNELAKIFKLINIDTQEVLKAAGTKWNFLPFKPGLVGGHCIGVDPYYLAQKAEELGYHPEIILAGRRMNDGMGSYIANQVVKLMIQKDLGVKDANVLVLGVTFKENCPDVRNTKVVDMIQSLREFGTKVDVFDPWADPSEVAHDYGIRLLQELEGLQFRAVVLAVAHTHFNDLDISKLIVENGVIYDVKGFLKIEVDGRL